MITNNKDSKIEEILLNIEKWLIRNKKLNNPMSYNEFMSLSVELGNHIRYLLIIITNLIPFDENGFSGYSTDEVFIAGLLAKISKLYDATVYHTCKNQSDIVNIFSRPIFEASQTMKYLIDNPDKISSCRKSSFMPVVRNFKYLISRGKIGSLTELENRMLTKIINNVKSDEFDIEEMADYNSGDWKRLKPNIKELHTKVEGSDAMYDFSHGILSRFVHSDWQDIKFNHVTTENGYYFPSLEHNPMDMQVLPLINIPVLDSLKVYLNWKPFDPSKSILNIVNNIISLNIELLIECDQKI